MNKKNIAIFMLFLIVIIIFFFSVWIYNLNISKNIGNNSNTQVIKASQNIEETVENDSIKTNSKETRISPNAIITFFKSYSDCGHTVKEKEEISNNMVNITQDELEKLYSDWNITKFTSSEIELSKNFSGTCNEHFFVKSKDGFVEIYNIKDDDTLELYEKTDIVVMYLTEEDIAELDKGITIYGKDNLNAYIENFE